MLRARFMAPLRPLAEAWQDAVRTPRARVLGAGFALVIAGSLLAARHGTTRTRLAAALAMLIATALAFVVRRREARLWDDPARVIRRLAGRVDPARAARALRALTLVGPDGESRAAGESSELARLHVARAIAALPGERIVAGASRHAMQLSVAALVASLATLLLVAWNPWGIVEGADVLFARHGVAPLDMKWLDRLEVRARLPEYLHEEERAEPPFGELALPRGTLLTFRGAAVHNGRRLLLGDGSSEVPFVDDGSGRMVARWPLEGTVTLRVLARFGNVTIQDPDATKVTSIEDRAPDVSLEGAPKKIQLAGGADVSEIPIRYDVTDDHGLREVHLVLRSGTREERRVLARLDGETRTDRGGHVLRATDPFVKKSHAPVEVRVEAKDNDPITGPKWGASPSITLIPPDVGEPESKRMLALRRLRDGLVDTLAYRIGHDVPAGAADRKVFIADETRIANVDAELLDATMGATFAGIRVPGRLQAMLRGQMRKLRAAIDAELKSPNATTRAAAVKATERIVLVVDAVIRGLALRDTREAARQLADVADDLALGATQLQRASDAERGAVRADSAAIVLEGGSKSMLTLGTLGRDLGEIVHEDLARVARARKENDAMHAELAARDLAARLRQPDPSFGSKGQSGGRGGGESGGGRGTPGDGAEGEGGDVEQAFNEAAQELERLAQDHAGQIGKVEHALAGASSEEEVKQLAEEAKRHAAAVREATASLPSVGAGSDSWTSKGSAAKEHGDQMARSLEQGNPADAVASGRNALQALDEARRIAQRERWSPFGGESDAERKIDDAKRRLEPEVKWSEEKLEQLRKRAAERAASELGQSGDEEEKMAGRAQGLRDKGKDQGLPSPAIDSLEAAERAAREAAQALKRGEADKGLERQREAQRMLEMAKEALGNNNGDGERGSEGDGDTSLDHADIPNADAHKGPEEFRRRVIKGLGQPASGRQKDAVRRYAEGLLR